MIKISIINDEISDNSDEVISFLKKHKLGYVEVRSFNKKNIANIRFSILRRQANFFKKNNIKVSCVASPLMKWGLENETTFKPAKNLLSSHFYIHKNASNERIFKIAEIFGAKYIRIFSFLRYENFKTADLKEAITELLGLAEKYDKVLLIENEPVCNINDVDGLSRFIKHFKSERLKILFDPGNIYRQGDVLDYGTLSAIKKNIKYLHIKDYSFARREYSVLGTGDINYKKFISWLKREIVDDIFISLETHLSGTNRSKGSAESLKYLRMLLSNKRVKYGVVGCGRVFNKHALAIKEDSNSELVGVFDIDRLRGGQAAKKYDCQEFSGLSELIAEVDVVNVCTPHNTHASIITQVLKANKKCLCEKPGSMSASDMAKIKSIKNYKKNLFIVYQNRFNQPIIKLRKILENKSLGQAIYVFGSVRWFRPLNYYFKSWQGDKKQEGGILFNQGIHILDIIMSLLDADRETIILNSIKDKIYHKNISTEDIFLAQFMVAKIIVNIEITVSSLPNNLDSSLFMLFDKGRALVGGKSLESSLKVNYIGAKRELSYDLSPNEDIYGSGHKILIEKLTKYIQTGKRDDNLVGFDQACARISLINRLYESCKKV